MEERNDSDAIRIPTLNANETGLLLTRTFLLTNVDKICLKQIQESFRMYDRYMS